MIIFQDTNSLHLKICEVYPFFPRISITYIIISHIKEAEWSTDEPSDLPSTFKYDLLCYKLSFSKKIYVLNLDFKI